MKSRVRMIIALLFVAMLALSATATAFGGGTGGGKGCNSGNGNGSEVVGTAECDPGNSGGHNNGGD